MTTRDLQLGLWGEEAPDDEPVTKPKVAVSHKPKMAKKRLLKQQGSVDSSSRVKRDLFSMPEADYVLIQQIRQRVMRAGLDSNKSEVVRAGLRLLHSLADDELQEAMASVERIKPGRRPKNSRIKKG